MNLVYQSLATIPNRYAFLDCIEQSVFSTPDLSLLLIDVVRFSDVSSSLGYKAGDYILSEIAQRVQLLLSDMSLMGRVSGDIFGVVIPGRHSKQQLQDYYNHMVEHFKTPISFDDHSFIADFNVGAAINSSQNRNTHELFSRAEAALKQAKQNKYENFYAVQIQDRVDSSRQLTLKADLKRAFEQDELELYFQPKVDINSLEIVGAECLLRWHHPLDGVIFPGPLLEAAESYNMMNEMGYWVLENAVKSLMHFKTAGVKMKLSVNMSPTQLYDSKFVANMQKLLQTYGASADELELELTEDIALSNSLMVHKQLSQLRQMGFLIAIDDFGKGYSNLAYMRDMEIDTIKIDKTFIMQLDENPVNRAIVRATQVIAESLGCEVVAEGIESLAHLHLLRDMGIKTGQGFLFARAVPLREFIELSQSEIIVGDSLAYQSRIA
ncbi:putative bifunctional diguanylate cyclase/phosphodiesterase [Neptunicella sp. SCSIO 80796]|uniref:putative bifunctional diguanylate cyclase/phosphodiesterase n=1 Tax=Neptunicella plasticusilytica TaxID=3117012 RepID=UPI003A4DF133